MALPDLTLTDQELQRLLHGATIARPAAAVLEVTGPGSLDCLQGLVTNDLVKPGPGSLVYAALLTPKGMIVTDLWVLRRREAISLVLPEAGRAPALEVFQRTLPPRLARLEDRSGSVGVAILVGDQSMPVLQNAGIRIPESGGRLIETTPDETWSTVARVSGAWFQAMIVADTAELDRITGKVESAGGVKGTPRDLEAARVLNGWPALGAEIDGRTLPQEVRFDQIGGVSYTKGCYLGQETVARLHFRGHPNRELRGLRWVGTPPLGSRTVFLETREVGTVRSTLTLPGRRLGLCPLRREVKLGDVVMAGDAPATVVPLPFEGLVEDAVG